MRTERSQPHLSDEPVEESALCLVDCHVGSAGRVWGLLSIVTSWHTFFLKNALSSSWFYSFYSQNVLRQIEQGWHTQTLHKQRTNTYTRFLRHLNVIS